MSYQRLASTQRSSNSHERLLETATDGHRSISESGAQQAGDERSSCPRSGHRPPSQQLDYCEQEDYGCQGYTG
jgi:hypothetical protein